MKPCCMVVLLGSLLAAPVLGALPTTRAEIAAIVNRAAGYQSGDDVQPLRQIEVLLRDAQKNPALRKTLEGELLPLLGPDATLEARRFACQQLAVMGSTAALPRLAALLSRERDASYACLALANYPPGPADEMLRQALLTNRGGARLQIIDTLGDRRDPKAVPALAAIVRENEFAPTRAAIIALAKIGNRSAREALAALRATAPAELERWFTEADLRIAEQLVLARQRRAAIAIYERLIEPSKPIAVRRGAFAALTRLEPSGGEARILRTLRGDDPVLKPVAIAQVRVLPGRGASERFARELSGLMPEEQAWLLDSLAARNDSAARAALINSLNSAHAAVRRAAAAALGRVGDANAVGSFANAIAAAPDADEARALESALGSLPPGRATDRAILAEIAAARSETRARLIAALATRPGPEVTAVLFAEADHSDPVVAKAAYRVLARAGAEESLSLLLRKFAALRNPALRSGVEGFVEQAVRLTESVAARSAEVRAVLGVTPDVESRCALLRLLPACGDAPAFATLNDAVRDGDASLRDAAIRALAEWPDLSAWTPLFTLWTQPGNATYRDVALQGLVRLADEANAAPDEQLVARYRELLARAQGEGELRKVLSALGGAAHPDVLALALPLLEKSAVRAEVEAAVKKIADAIKKQHPEAAQAALDRLAGK